MLTLTILLSGFVSAAFLADDREQALELAAAGRWEQSRPLLEAEVAATPDWGEGWFSLGIARRELGELDGAQKAFLRALALDYQPQRTHIGLALTLSRRGDDASAIEHIEKGLAAGVPFAILRTLPFADSTRNDDRFRAMWEREERALFPCRNDPRYRALDFWIGRWDVRAPDGGPVGTSEILGLERGCLVREQWTNGYGGTGQSMNFYDPADDRWHQIWVDENGGVVRYTGGPDDGRFVYEGTNVLADGTTRRARVSLTPQPDGTVNHSIRHSVDNGQTWASYFEAVYHPAQRADEEPTIEKLDWLIGSWDFDDAEIDGDYRETGTRVCEYALDRDYIVCESHGTSHTGKKRTYLNYFNYNHLDGRFEITALFGGFPRTMLYKVEASDDGHRLELDSAGWEADALVFDGHATLTYNGEDRYVWESASFRDVVTRRSE